MLTIADLKNLATCARIALSAQAGQLNDGQLLEIAGLPTKCAQEIANIEASALPADFKPAPVKRERVAKE